MQGMCLNDLQCPVCWLMAFTELNVHSLHTVRIFLKGKEIL